ncbi:hypothetical protein, conserved [Babesia bigemina]|uniref:Uncharacterized protein n=1 Tax=Babesia bigemina TaxID=5866 RepID=A0A061D9X6_BABBI|nr:hypothetical protein, conserved [Babesia bigemina]CDR96772.1 hypothetical protein, conserved [Babesia bigemina]|eukprot:XP_012768958.1 hypothetical protein, conserved [Babesia bigemina]
MTSHGGELQCRRDVNRLDEHSSPSDYLATAGKKGIRASIKGDQIASIDDIVGQPGAEDAAFTDTSFASSLTRESLNELQMQEDMSRCAKGANRTGQGMRRRSDIDERQQYTLLHYSVPQQLELLDELIRSLGQCYPRWKHRRFGLQRFYCHMFNIHMDPIARSNYVQLFCNIWDGFEKTGINSWSSGNIWLQLLTHEYQVHRAKPNDFIVQREYSNSKRVEEVLQQLDEISSCFCNERCAMDFMRHSSYWGPTAQTTVTHEEEPVKEPISACFANTDNLKKGLHTSKINTIASFYQERGIIHNFTRPYEHGVQVTPMPGFRRSVVCLSCGRVCWCSCERKLFRNYREEKEPEEPDHVSVATESGESQSENRDHEYEEVEKECREAEAPEEDEEEEQEEITDIHEFVNTLQNKKQSLHPNIAKTAITVSNARKVDSGIILCYHTNEAEEYMSEPASPSDLKQQLLRATVLRGSVEDIFDAIKPRMGDFQLPEHTHGIFEEWRKVPLYRSWRRCWWRLVGKGAMDTSDDAVRPFVQRALERLDALGNVRYNLECGYVAVGYLQKRSRTCSYWRHFYVRQHGLWRAFTKAAEYNLMICTLPLELQLDPKAMNWTVCKCHQGDMYRKSFSTVKRGLVLGYAMAISWYENLLQELNGVATSFSDFDEESDVGCDEFDEQHFLKRDPAIYEGVNTVERAFLSAKRRKMVLAGDRGFGSMGRSGSRADSDLVDPRIIASAKEKLMLDHNLWYADIQNLFPEVTPDGFVDPEPAKGMTLRNLVAQYSELKDYFTLSLKHVDECVYTLKMCVNNALTKGNMDLVEPILRLNDDKKLADVIPQVPMQWVSFQQANDSWTCVLECHACITCAPRACTKQNCTKFQNGKEVIELLRKKFGPCSVEFTRNPFQANEGESAEPAPEADECCVVGFSAQKFGFNGAKALATEFRKRFIQIVFSSMKYDGSFSDALLGMIAEEIGLLTSTDAYILPNKANEEQRQNLIESLTCGVCSTFGDRMQHRNGTVLLKQLVKSSVPGKRLSEVFALEQMAEAILLDFKLDIKFCPVHMAWVVWWLDCMQQKRVMFYRVEDLISVNSLEEALAELEKHWMDAVSAHVEYTVGHAAERCQLTITYRFEEAFHHLTGLQKNLYDAFHTAFAMALRAITDSRQEFKLIKRLWQINKNEPEDLVAQDVNAQSFALTETVVFPFGALHDEGTPPLSDAE